MANRRQPLQGQDPNRIVGVGFIFRGTALLVFSLVFLGTFSWLGLPRTTTPLRMVVFGIVGLILGLTGYRLASGSLSGGFQTVHRSAALAGVLFLGVFLRNQLNVRRPPPPVWMLGIAALTPISWWLVAHGRQPRHL
jgi:hypothetical protein